MFMFTRGMYIFLNHTLEHEEGSQESARGALEGPFLKR